MANAPAKLVSAGFSPFLISLGMVAGVFVGRWTVPSLLKGGSYPYGAILRRKPHLIVWAILARMCWAVANTLTVFAIRGVGLSIAFPLWNMNSLVGLFWGWALFGGLRGGEAGNWLKVLGEEPRPSSREPAQLRSRHRQQPDVPPRQATLGILAALGAAAFSGAPCTFHILRKSVHQRPESALLRDG